jgi:DNA processing protein
MRTHPEQVSDPERLARAMLSTLAEPGGALLGRLVSSLGPIEAVEAVRTGSAPGGLIQSHRDHQTLAGWRERLRAADPEAALDLCARLGGRLVCPGGPEWPSQLDDLGPEAPQALWLRGPGNLRHGCLRSVAVVGARAATNYGTRTASELAADLSDRGWTVVSGAALGIDAAAHRGALAAGDPGDQARTIAVLACGIDVHYPPRNAALLAEIAERALLISEWPPGTHPTRGRFLVRNRVIAALTRGTMVVEADLRSGSLNTAGYAERLNRPVLVLPGPVTSRMSRGCHRWLRDGRAECATDAAEIVETLGMIGDDLAPVERGPEKPWDHLDHVTRQVLDAVPAHSDAITEEIATAAAVDLNTTRSRLALLASAGLVTSTSQGWRTTATNS